MTTPPALAEDAPNLSMGFREFVVMMAALMAINALGIDSMLPALPAIARSIGLSSENQQQWIIASYMLGFGASQIVFGPLADRFGRKPVVLFGLIVYAATSIAASFAASFTMIVVARALQGGAAAATRVLVISIVRDCYEGRQMARVMSLTFIIFLAIPILAPSMGQFIMLVAPWNTIFHALALFAIGTALWVMFRLPETLHPSYRRSMTVDHLWSATKTVIGNRYSLGYTLAGTVIFGSLMGYINSSQQIFAETLGAGEYFALIFAFTAASMGFASFLNSRIVERWGTRLLSHAATVGFITIAMVHIMWSIFFQDTVVSFTIFQFMIMFFFGSAAINFGAMSMEPMGAIAGIASSIQGTISTLLGAVIGIEIGQHYDGTVFPVICGTLLCGIAALAIIFITERGRLFQPHHSAP